MKGVGTAGPRGPHFPGSILGALPADQPVRPGWIFVQGRNHLLRRALLVATATAHMTLTAAAALGRVVVSPVQGAVNLGIVVVEPVQAGWLVLDSVGLLFLGITSVLFFVASLYTLGYLARESTAEHRDPEEGLLFSNAPEAIFTACFLFFLSTMTLVTVSHHFGLLWVGI